jgi:transcriptional regulator with XRE-family HTH domain
VGDQFDRLEGGRAGGGRDVFADRQAVGQADVQQAGLFGQHPVDEGLSDCVRIPSAPIAMSSRPLQSTHDFRCRSKNWSWSTIEAWLARAPLRRADWPGGSHRRIRANVSTSDEPTPFGALLRHHRVAAGLTQADLADRAGLSARGVSDLERGARRAPHPHTVRQLATALRLSDDDTAALMAAGRRNDASGGAGSAQRTSAEMHTTAPTVPRLPTGRPALVAATGLLVVVIALVALLLPPRFESTPEVPSTLAASRAPSPTDDSQLLLADTLTDPSTAAFTRALSGSTQASFSDGGSATYQWDFAYMYSAIVAHVLGPYPANPDDAWLAAGATLDKPLPRDFAIQVRARATRSPEASAFGLAFQTGSDQLYQFEVTPADQGYRLWLVQGQAAAAQGRSTWILPPSQPNLIRMEIRGDTLRALTNGHELARAGPPELDARQGGSVSLRWAMTGPPSEGSSVEVRFAQFALYALP